MSGLKAVSRIAPRQGTAGRPQTIWCWLLLASCLSLVSWFFAAVVLAQAPPPGASAATGANEARSLSEWLSPWFAAPIGAFGASAYLVAVYCGFVARDLEGRNRILGYFGRWWSVPVYLITGAGVALVFQLPEKNLVPIQAFILGCTWPAVVSNYLSARQSGQLPESERKEVEELTEQKKQLDVLTKQKRELDVLTALRVPDLEEAKKKAGEALQQLRKRGGTPPPPQRANAAGSRPKPP